MNRADVSVGELTMAWAHYDRRLAALDAMNAESLFADGSTAPFDIAHERDEVAKRRAHVEQLLDERLSFDKSA